MSEQRSMTRRSIAAFLGTATASAATSAQTQLAASPEPNEAEATIRRNIAALKKVNVPRETEPAFQFQA